MTNEEFELERQKIITEFGKPIRDWDSANWNESARRIKLLTERKRKEALADRRAKDNSLKAIVNDVPKDVLKTYSFKPLRPIYLEDKDLKQFNDLEKEILQAHYEDSSLNNQQLAERFGVKRQQITALFNSMEAKLLKIKLFEREVPDKVRLALLQLVEEGNQKTVERLAEHFGIIKPEKQDINITSKPIEDVEAMKMLKELGDKMSEQAPPVSEGKDNA